MSFVILVALLEASREASSARRASSVWWPVLDIGLGFGPGGSEDLSEGPEGGRPKGPSSPWAGC